MAEFNKIIGTGGIGAGIMYRLIGNHDLGRNESRPAVFLDQKDYCKLHIIFHYIAKILKDLKYKVEVIPIGAVGDDDCGRRLLEEMKEVGMNLQYVKMLRDKPTLFAVCYCFPDGSGGNLTESNSASGRVSPRLVKNVEAELKNNGNQCLVLAAPEVPLKSRITLLKIGRRYGTFTAASFVSEEMAESSILQLLKFIDLLAINIDEAAILAGVSSKEKAENIVQSCIDKIVQVNADMKISITNGRYGAYAYENGKFEYLPALKVKAVNTAGAGDAAFAGLVIGLVIGLPFSGDVSSSCLRFSRLLAAMSVMSLDTINFAVNTASLKAFAKEYGQEYIF